MENNSQVTGFRFCDMRIMAKVFYLLQFPECNQQGLLLEEDYVSCKGCASRRRIAYVCDWKHLFHTSSQNDKSFEINRRLVYSIDVELVKVTSVPYEILLSKTVSNHKNNCRGSKCPK